MGTSSYLLLTCTLLSSALLIHASNTSVSPHPHNNQPTPAASVTCADDVILTPWWPLVLSVGEQVSIDCGYCVGTSADHALQWLYSNGTSVADPDRIQITEAADDSNSGRYSTVTLTIKSLLASDSGTYVCRLGTDESQSASITLTVLSPEVSCGFESEAICGWENVVGSTRQWSRQTGSISHDSQNRHNSMPAYDHTYGPSKHQGSFLHADGGSSQTGSDNTHPVIRSALHGVTNEPLCLHYWYTMAVTDGGQLNVYLLSVNGTTNTRKPLQSHNVSTGLTWTHAMTQIQTQTTPFRFAFEAALCSAADCEEDCIAVDDVLITSDQCTDTDIQQTGMLKMRLVDDGLSDRRLRLEILHGAQYYTVCDSEVGEHETAVVCKSFNFSTSAATVVSSSTPDRKWLTGLSCTGSETHLAQCLHSGHEWGVTSTCQPAADAFISCTDSKASQSENDDHNENGGEKETLAASSTLTSISTSTAPTASSIPTSTTSTTTSTPTSTSPSTTTSTTISSTESSTVSPTLVPSTRAPTLSTTVQTSTTALPSTTSLHTTTSASKHASHHTGYHVGVGLIVILVIVALVILVLFYIIYRGRKRRRRKSKYQSFGGPSYSTQHLPTNEFHMESPLTTSSMGYTVLA